LDHRSSGDLAWFNLHTKQTTGEISDPLSSMGLAGPCFLRGLGRLSPIFVYVVAILASLLVSIPWLKSKLVLPT
jgi:hypothetical protein